MICVGIEEAGPAQRGEKQSGGLFFRPWEIPRIPERSSQDCETEFGFVRVTMRKRAFFSERSFFIFCASGFKAGGGMVAWRK